MLSRKIKVSIGDDRCFFHIYGDQVKYFDLDSLAIKHPDMKEYIELNRFELERSLQKQREQMNFTDKF